MMKIYIKKNTYINKIKSLDILPTLMTSKPQEKMTLANIRSNLHELLNETNKWTILKTLWKKTIMNAT